jgi:hypothetical protein
MNLLMFHEFTFFQWICFACMVFSIIMLGLGIHSFFSAIKHWKERGK